MKFKVIHPFRDLQDKSKKFPNGKIYAVGDIYLSEDEERIKELSTKANKIGKSLIEPIKEEKEEGDAKVEEVEKEPINIEEYHTGYGWYEYEGKKYRKDDLIKLLEGD